MKLRRLGQEANRDELIISTLNKDGGEAEPESLCFAFNKESYEVDVTEHGPWQIGIQIRPCKELSQPLSLKIRVEIFGRVTDLQMLDALT